jgi:hypothetical protein
VQSKGYKKKNQRVKGMFDLWKPRTHAFCRLFSVIVPLKAYLFPTT